jgi:hypothetical protein
MGISVTPQTLIILYGAARHGAPGLYDLANHAVLHPLRAPPVERCDLLSAHQHREVEVIAAGETRHAAAAELLPFLHLVADFHRKRRQVPVERLDAHSVVDHHAVAVDAQIRGVNHRPALRRANRRVSDRREVEAEVNLRVHLLALVDVRARVGELRLHLRIAKLPERIVELQFGRCLGREARDVRVVLAPEVAVDLEEPVQQAVGVHLLVGRARGDRGHDAGQEPIVHLDTALRERLREHHVVERCHRLIAGGITREHVDRRIQVLIPEQREERHAQRGIAWNARARSRKPAIFLVAYAHARLHIRRCGAVHDEFAAAMIDVMKLRQHGHLRRLQPHLHIASGRRFRLSQPVHHRP